MIWSNYVFLCNTFQIECKEGLFLDVILKTRFFEGQNRQNPTTVKKKGLQTNKFLSDLVSKLLIIFVKKKKDIVINQLKLMC